MAKSVREQVGIDPSEEEQAALDAATAAAGEPPAGETPEWLDPKFATVEDQAKAYREAEQKAGRNAQELGDLREQMAEMALQQQQTPPYQPQPAGYDPANDPVLSQLQAAWEQGDMRTFMAINLGLNQAQTQQLLEQSQQRQTPYLEAQAAQIGQMTNELAIREVAGQYGDQWTEEFENRVGTMLQQHPQLVPEGADLQTTVNGLGLAAQLVRSQQQAEQVSAAAAQDEASRRGKMLAQTASGSTGRVGGQQNPADVLVEAMKGLRTGGCSGRG